MINVRDVIVECEGRLQAAGVESAAAEAEWLVAASLGLSRTELYLRREPLEAAAVTQVRA